MTRSVLSEETLDILDELVHALYVLESDLTNKPPTTSNNGNLPDVVELTADTGSVGPSSNGPAAAGFNLADHWSRNTGICQMISKESTNICMVFIDQFPTGPICKSIVERLSKPVLALYAQYSALPASVGLLCRKSCYHHVITVVKRLNQLVVAIKSGPEKIQLASQKTGSVWEACDASAQLPKNNLDALRLLVEMKLAIVDDAIAELSQWLREQFSEDSQSLASIHEEVAEPAADPPANRNNCAKICTFGVGMVKSVKAVLKQTNRNINTLLTEQQNSAATGSALCLTLAVVQWCDRLGLAMENVDSWCDDMAVALYSFEEDPSAAAVMAGLIHQAGSLKSDGMALIDDVMCHVTVGDGQNNSAVKPANFAGVDRYEFLKKVFVHNFDKISELGL